MFHKPLKTTRHEQELVHVTVVLVKHVFKKKKEKKGMWCVVGNIIYSESFVYWVIIKQQTIVFLMNLHPSSSQLVMANFTCTTVFVLNVCAISPLCPHTLTNY